MTKEEARQYLENYRKMFADMAPEKFIEALDVTLADTLPSNFEEAVEKYLESQTPADQGEEMVIYNAFKEGAKAIVNQKVSLGYLISWYIQSVDGHQPIWTEEHLKELDKDFIIIPKNSF